MKLSYFQHLISVPFERFDFLRSCFAMEWGFIACLHMITCPGGRGFAALFCQVDEDFPSQNSSGIGSGNVNSWN